MVLHINFITDETGNIISVILPIDEFNDLIETYGIDLSKDEVSAIEKGKSLRSQGDSVISKEYVNIDDI